VTLYFFFAVNFKSSLFFTIAALAITLFISEWLLYGHVDGYSYQIPYKIGLLVLSALILVSYEVILTLVCELFATIEG
jgi:hypothetical protein